MTATCDGYEWRGEVPWKCRLPPGHKTSEGVFLGRSCRGGDVTIVLSEAAALREYLDNLNEAGTRPIVVGIDASPQPFLITLIGPYAESEDVFFDSPWQSDIDYGERVDGEWVPKQPRCDECQAMVHGIEDLRFPVVVIVQEGQ